MCGVAWESNARHRSSRQSARDFLQQMDKHHASFIRRPAPDPPIPPGFSLWDFYAAKRIYRGLEFFGAVDNFTDSRDPNVGAHRCRSFRPELGRTFRVGMRFTWAQERR